MTVYVLTDGWYDDMTLKGVVSSLDEAMAWVDDFEPSYEGDYNRRDWVSFKIGEIDE
ncbi:DUF7336 domain-containing protein [Streptomyces ardesiacus]|uniref:DUF7336 domain-containing protein n=1 Tax=Streptomyces ardesiacus TaxID=285564 RepID=UPI0036497F28